MSFLRVRTLMTLTALLATPAVRAQAEPKRPAPEPPKTPTYAVVQVHKDLRVVPSDGVATLKKSLEADDRAALERCDAEKKAALAAKLEFKDQAPKKPSVKVLRDGFKSEADAKAFVAEQEKKPADEPHPAPDAPHGTNPHPGGG